MSLSRIVGVMIVLVMARRWLVNTAKELVVVEDAKWLA